MSTPLYKPMRRLTTTASILVGAKAVSDIAMGSIAQGVESASGTEVLLLLPVVALDNLLFLVTATVFLIWIYRAGTNLQAFGRTGMKYSPGEAVGWWFVPVANLFVPFRAMKEIFQASNPEVPVGREFASAWISRAVPWVVTTWWLFFIGRSFASLIISYFEHSAGWGTVQSPAGQMTRVMLTIVAALACIAMLRMVSKRQEALATMERPSDIARQEALAAGVDLTSKLGHVPDRSMDV